MERTKWHFWVSEWLVNARVPFFWSYLSIFVDIVLHFPKKFRLPRSTSASGHTARTPSCCNWSLWIGIQLAFSLQTPLQNGHLQLRRLVLPLFSFFRLPSKPARGVAREGGMGCPCTPSPSGERHPNVPSLTTLKTKANGPSKIVADTPDYEPASLGYLW